MGEEAFGVLKILYQYYFFLKLRRAQLADTADKYLRLRLHTDSANFQYYVKYFNRLRKNYVFCEKSGGGPSLMLCACRLFGLTLQKVPTLMLISYTMKAGMLEVDQTGSCDTQAVAYTCNLNNPMYTI